jgi:hypothetical protein
MLGKRNVYAAKAKRITVVLLVLSVFAIASMITACSSQSSISTYPLIDAGVSPLKVRPGDTMLVTASCVDPAGIETVTADMGGIETIQLSLISGTICDGTWQATWLVHDTEVRDYNTTVTATNVFGECSSVNVGWSDPATAGMIAYGEGVLTAPRYRLWTGAAWDIEQSANDVGGVTNMVVLRSARTRDEKILGVLDKSGDINVQVWDGGTWGTALEVTTVVADYDYRGFDIAYEDSSGDAIIVYQNNVDDPLYRVWNGTSWSDAATLDLPTAGIPVWIRMASKPGSDEIIVATLDKGLNVTAAVWGGSAWGNSINLEGAAESYEYNGIAIAYESISGDAMVAWSRGTDTSGGPRYRFWDGSAWGAEATAPETGDEQLFIELGSDPLSDKIVMGAIDTSNIPSIDINVWNGTASAWGGNTEAVSQTMRNKLKPADVGFESTSGEAMAVYVAKNDLTLHYRNWSTGSGWSEQKDCCTLDSLPQTGDIRPDPNSDDIMIAIVDANEDLRSAKWNGSACGTPETLETSTSSTFASFMLSYDRHFIISDVNAGGPYEAGETISVNWSLTGSASATEDYLNVEYWDATDGVRFDLKSCATTSATSSTSKSLTGSEIEHEIAVYVYTTSSSTGDRSTAITQGTPWGDSTAEIQGPIITSCDKDGNEINQFAPGENVSVSGTGLDPETNYTIWIQLDQVNESDPIDSTEDPSTTSPKNETVKTDEEGNFSATLIWPIPTGAAVTNTAYDIVVDNLESGTVGTYNAADDGIDDADVAGIVAPVPDVSSLVLFASGLVLVSVYFEYGRRKKEEKKK